MFLRKSDKGGGRWVGGLNPSPLWRFPVHWHLPCTPFLGSLSSSPPPGLSLPALLNTPAGKAYFRRIQSHFILKTKQLDVAHVCPFYNGLQSYCKKYAVGTLGSSQSVWRHRPAIKTLGFQTGPDVSCEFHHPLCSPFYLCPQWDRHGCKAHWDLCPASYCGVRRSKPGKRENRKTGQKTLHWGQGGVSNQRNVQTDV